MLRLGDLQPLPFITMGEAFYPGAREWIHRVCGTAGFTPTIAHEVDRAPTMIGLVALELGVALLPEACMKLPHAGAVFRPLAEQVKSRIEIVWKERNLSRSLLHFIETVRECFAAEPVPFVGMADKRKSGPGSRAQNLEAASVQAGT